MPPGWGSDSRPLWNAFHNGPPTIGTPITTTVAARAGYRQRLLKIGTLVRVSTRRVYVRLASAFPLQKLFAQVHRALAGLVAEDG